MNPSTLKPTVHPGLMTAVLLALTGGCAITPSGPAASELRSGQGPVVVVLQSGLGDGKEVWRKLQPALGPQVTSIAFDRPGYGGVAAVGGARSPCRIAEELHQRLQASGLPPPYLLVGHSLGGLYQAAYARLYSREVSGLVLLEPTHVDHWPALQQEVPMMASLVRALRQAMPEAARREFDDQRQCAEQLAAKPLPKVPSQLLVRSDFRGLEAGAFEAMLLRLQADWARQLGGIEVQRVADSGHHLQRDRPDAVAAAIDRAIVALRAGKTE